MRILVDATCWPNRRGFGRHARSLVTALVEVDRENRYTLVMDGDGSGPLPPGVEVRRVRTTVPTTVAASANGRRTFGDLYAMSRALSDPAFDVVLFPAVYSYVPVLSRARKVVIVHDTIAHDYPEMALSGRASRLFWSAKTAVALRQAHAVVAVSEYARRSVVDRLRVSSRRTFVVGEAADSVFRVIDDPRPTPQLHDQGVTGDLVVHVGGFSPHKNVDLLVDVFAAIAGRYPDARLVLVGEGEREVFRSCYDAVRRRAEGSGLAGRVVFTGFLPDEDLVVLLNLATVLVMPSMMEGFGLPAVEAAACGCPVIATDASPLPELLGDAGLYVRPGDRADLESALTRVLESAGLRERMSAAGIEAARRLTWEDAARRMAEILRQVAAG
ncbi:MAG: hypothetical protein QOD06_2553 [Candidatus Binatota bacterium]|nr:hypothetical protein [Candidatus Binatota bacterium]